MNPDPAQQSRAVLVKALVASGAVMVAAGLLLGLAVEPILLLIAGLGLVDFIVAWAFHTGRLGGAGLGVQPVPATEQQPADAASPDVIAAEATDDPSYNPYARED